MRDSFDTDFDGQMTISDLFDPPERLFAVSRIFARARKNMSLDEQKTFVYALTQIKFKEELKDTNVYLDKKKLAHLLGIHSDPKHLSVDLFSNIKELPLHSFIEIAEVDKGFYSSGCVVTSVSVATTNVVRVKFEKDYLGLFTNLSTGYITMWSIDIFQMSSRRSVVFYEYLRQITDTRNDINSCGLGIKALKELFDIPKDGKGSYMRQDGHFDRPAFEKYVLEPLCADMSRCKMIQLVVQPTGKLYEKVKQGGRVAGYRFYWTLSQHPAVATAAEVKSIQERVDKNPQILKVTKDLLNGEKQKKSKPKGRPVASGRDYSEMLDELISMQDKKED